MTGTPCNDCCRILAPEQTPKLSKNFHFFLPTPKLSKNFHFFANPGTFKKFSIFSHPVTFKTFSIFCPPFFELSKNFQFLF
jgi:hypothetical protein